MQRDLDKMRRRPFFFPLVLPVLLFIAVVAIAAWLFDARATTVVFVVRHAEVESQSDADPDLSVDGREALIATGVSCGWTCGSGFLLYLRRGPDGRWTVVDSITAWIS